MIHRALPALVLFAALVLSETCAQSTAADEKAIRSAVEAFHSAIRRGDRAAALDLLAPGALILESGSAQSREEYAREHLAEDIAFAKAVPRALVNFAIERDGKVAWTTTTSQSVGSFKGRDVNSVGVELIVLSKSKSGWRIRAIHWSSRRR